MMTIQWYPGHMAKAKREVEEKLKLVDFLIELVDARAPLSSQNPMLQQVLQQKEKMIVMMKSDLADPMITEKWLTYFQQKNIPGIAINVNNRVNLNKVIQLAKELGQKKLKKLAKKGMQPRA